MKAVAEHKAPVSKADRTNFVILPSTFLLHAIILLVEIYCVDGFRKGTEFQGESTHKVEHASGYHEIGDCARTQIPLVTIGQREDIQDGQRKKCAYVEQLLYFRNQRAIIEVPRLESGGSETIGII
jgi:hypothetical protein